MSLKILLASLVTFLSLGGVGLYFSYQGDSSNRELASIDPEKGSENQNSDSQLLPSKYKFEKNKTYVFELKRRIHVKLLNKLIPLDYTGELKFWAGAAGNLRPRINSTFAELSLNAAHSKIGHKPKTLLVTHTNEGENVKIFTDKDSPGGQDVELAKDAVNLFFFPIKEDSAGKYEASIEWKDQGLVGRKKKIRYLESKSNPTILSSTHIAMWKAGQPVPAKVWGKEETRMGDSSSSMEASSIYEIKLTRVEEGDFSGKVDFKKFNQALAWAVGSHGDQTKSLGHNIDKAKVTERLKRMSLLSQGEQLGLFSEVLSLLKEGDLELAELRKVLEETRDPLDRGPLYKLIVGALATQGGPLALAELVNIYKSEDTPMEVRATILAALATTEAPIDQATRDFLAETYNKEQNARLKEGAAYAYGSSLSSLKQEDSILQSEVSKVMAAWQRLGAGYSSEKIVMLDLIGNSGRAEFFPLVQEAYLSGDARLQTKSVMAARSMNSNDSVSFILNSLSNLDSSIRFAATQALRLGEWNERYRPVIAQCSLSEADVDVKAQCQEILKIISSKVATR